MTTPSENSTAADNQQETSSSDYPYHRTKSALKVDATYDQISELVSKLDDGTENIPQRIFDIESEASKILENMQTSLQDKLKALLPLLDEIKGLDK